MPNGFDTSCKRRSHFTFFYTTVCGRIVLHLLTARWVSRLCGAYMSSRLSCLHIRSFIKKNGIDPAEFEDKHYHDFNDFFTRRVKDGFRPVDRSAKAFIAPCDSFLSVYYIENDTVISAKQSRYTVGELLGDETAAARYRGGNCFVFRLCPEHYHRYCFIDDATVSREKFIPGVLHTVRPIALEGVPVFVRNCREVCFLQTAHFGTVAEIEVGAMLVGKICNHPVNGAVGRGQEKGYFMFGGSTVILLTEKDTVVPDTCFSENEIAVKQGQKIGTQKRL